MPNRVICFKKHCVICTSPFFIKSKEGNLIMSRVQGMRFKRMNGKTCSHRCSMQYILTHHTGYEAPRRLQEPLK